MPSSLPIVLLSCHAPSDKSPANQPRAQLKVDLKVKTADSRVKLATNKEVIDCIS